MSDEAESICVMNEERVPVENENANTPKSISTQQNILSGVLNALKSP